MKFTIAEETFCILSDRSLEARDKNKLCVAWNEIYSCGGNGLHIIMFHLIMSRESTICKLRYNSPSFVTTEQLINVQNFHASVLRNVPSTICKKRQFIDYRTDYVKKSYPDSSIQHPTQ